MVGRAELLSAFFYLSSILTWISSSRSSSPVADGNSSSSSPFPFHLFFEHRRKLAAIVLAFVGFLCKEQSILALPYLALFELIDFGGVQNNSTSSTSKTPKVISNHHHHHLNHRSSSRSGTFFSPLPPPSLLSFRRKSSPSFGSSFFRSALSLLSTVSFGAVLLLGSSFLFALYLRLSIMHFSLPTFSR